MPYTFIGLAICFTTFKQNNSLKFVSVDVDVERILVQLLPDIPELLLFMKNVRKVKVCVIQESNQGAAVLSTSLRVDTPLPSVFLPDGQFCCTTIIWTTGSKPLPAVKGDGMPSGVEVATSKKAWFRSWDSVAAVAVLLNSNAPPEGKIFCGMPLPLFTKNLPVHTNGEVNEHCFCLEGCSSAALNIARFSSLCIVGQAALLATQPNETPF